MHFLTALIALLAIATVVQSRKRYSPKLHRWIMKETRPAKYKDASAICEGNRGILASPLTTDLYNYLKSVNMSTHYIGTYKDSSSSDKEYVTKEGKRLRDLPMAVSDEIQQLDGTQGDCLAMDRSGIHVVSCETKLPFVCYSDITTDCGYGCIYSNVTGSSYVYYGYISTWQEAKHTCEARDNYLVVVNDAAEATVVVDIMEKEGYLDPWVGLRDYRTGGVTDWHSVRGEPLEQIHNEWGPNRNLNSEKYGCAAMDRYKLLVNYDCQYMRYFICESSE